MIMCRVVVASLAIAALAGSARADFGPNLLNNQGFESDLGFDFSNPANWNGFFGGPAGTFLEAFNNTGAAPRSGERALVTTIRGAAGVTQGFGAFTGHAQTVTGLTAGLDYELAVWARGNPSLNTGVEFRVEWQNASGGEISRRNVEIQSLLGSSYQQVSFIETAPAGATRAVIVLAVQSFLNDGQFANTSVAWDDASFRTVPGPASAGLLTLGMLAAARRRR